MRNQKFKCVFAARLFHLEGFWDAAPPLSSGSQRDLHEQAFHGPTENDGGGEGASSAGLPLSEETEAGAARSQVC